MSAIELGLIGLGLSMDAFAVSISKGLSDRNYTLRSSLICGLYFGIFQGAMPLIGYFLGYGFKDIIEEFDHWIAFVVLAAIGISMIRGVREHEAPNLEEGYSFRKMLPLAIATSIDALAVGVSFAFLKVNIWVAALSITLITFVFSNLGVKLGSTVGIKYKEKAEIAGGIILILIGLKILMEHLGVI